VQEEALRTAVSEALERLVSPGDASQTSTPPQLLSIRTGLPIHAHTTPEDTVRDVVVANVKGKEIVAEVLTQVNNRYRVTIVEGGSGTTWIELNDVEQRMQVHGHREFERIKAQVKEQSAARTG
jgi:hypothetical protein